MVNDSDRTPAVEFKIEGFSLKDLPLHRVADYIKLLSNLLGAAKEAHLSAVKNGSVHMPVCVSTPDAHAKIFARIALAKQDNRSSARDAYLALDDELARNGGYGWLEDAITKRRLLELPGVKNLASALPPITEEDTLQGRLLGINYRTSANDTSGRLHSAGCIDWFHCSEQLAMDLAPLYLKHIRLRGKASWQRKINGDWKLLDFEAESFVILKKDSLLSVREEIRQAGGFGFDDTESSYADLLEMRD